MIVLDASVLIGHFDGDDVHHGRADALLAAAQDELGASSLTLAEVLMVPVREGRAESVLLALRDLEVRELPVPPDDAVRLARLRAETGLRMADCCVLLVAETLGAAVATFDERLAGAAERRSLPVLGR